MTRCWHLSASAPDWPPCWSFGTAALSRTASRAHSVGRSQTTTPISNTSVVFAGSSIRLLGLLLIPASAPHRYAERLRAEENEEAFTGSFSKKTPPKKAATSNCPNRCTFRLLVAARECLSVELGQRLRGADVVNELRRDSALCRAPRRIHCN